MKLQIPIGLNGNVWCFPSPTNIYVNISVGKFHTVTLKLNVSNNCQGSHFSALTKFQDISRILYKIPGIIFIFFNVASTYNWVSVYTLYNTSTLFCLHYPKVCIPPLTATHNDLYHFERWVLIKKTQKLMT